jgi:hypothetical protein
MQQQNEAVNALKEDRPKKSFFNNPPSLSKGIKKTFLCNDIDAYVNMSDEHEEQEEENGDSVENDEGQEEENDDSVENDEKRRRNYYIQEVHGTYRYYTSIERILCIYRYYTSIERILGTEILYQICQDGMAIACHVSKLPGSLSSERIYVGNHNPTIQLTSLETHDRKNEFCFESEIALEFNRARLSCSICSGDDVNGVKIHFSQLIWHSCETFTLQTDEKRVRTIYYVLVYLVRSEGDLKVIHVIFDDPEKNHQRSSSLQFRYV